MKTKFIIPISILCILSTTSCKNQKTDNQNTINEIFAEDSSSISEDIVPDTFVTKKITVHKLTTIDAKNDKTIEFKTVIDYPAGTDTSKLASSLRQWINSTLSYSDSFSMTEDGEPTSVFKGKLNDGKIVAEHYQRRFTKGAIADYREATADGSSSYGPSYSYEANIGKLYENKHLLTYRTETYTYLGGAHPSTNIDFASIRKTDGHLLTWDDVFTKAGKKRVAALIKKELARLHKENGNEGAFEEELMIDTHISGADFPFPTTDPCITATGITFLYNQYEIACYAYGIPTATLDFNVLRPYLRPEIQKLIGIE